MAGEVGDVQRASPREQREEESELLARQAQHTPLVCAGPLPKPRARAQTRAVVGPTGGSEGLAACMACRPRGVAERDAIL